MGPCRDWVRGRCQYGDKCRFPHPPFDLPDGPPPQKDPIAKPAPDAPMWRDMQRVRFRQQGYHCRTNFGVTGSHTASLSVPVPQ